MPFRKKCIDGTKRLKPLKNIDNIDFDACNINPDYIEKIEGLQSNSSSFTDIWFLHFKHNVYYNYINSITSGVYKIFINNDTLEDSNNNILALKYEFNIYKYKILPLIENNISPSFIRCLSSGENCSYDNLFNILNNKLEELNSDQIHANLKRNIYYMFSKLKNRPAINNIKPNTRFINEKIHNKENDIINKFKYNIIFTKSINTDTTRTLEEFLDESTLPLERDTDRQNIVWELLFQIAVSCYMMSLSRMNHNDLHFANIFVEELDELTTFAYIINGKTYILNTRFRPYIYDFDQSFAESLGENPFLNGLPCEKAFLCNDFVENSDILFVLSYMFTYFYKSQRILTAVIENPNLLKIQTFLLKFIEIFKGISNRQINLRTVEFESKFVDTFKIIDNISKYVVNLKNNISKEHHIQHENIYVCDKDRNFHDGEFIKDEEYYYDMLKMHLNIDFDDVEFNALRNMKVYSSKRTQSAKSPVKSRSKSPVKSRSKSHITDGKKLKKKLRSIRKKMKKSFKKRL